MLPRTLGGLLAATAICIASPVQGQTRAYVVPPGDLHSALSIFARQSGLQILYRVDDVRGVQSRGANGTMTAETALDAILAGTEFSWHRDPSGAIAIAARPRSVSAVDVDEQPIEVTGSRIRGAPPAAPVIEITAEDMRVAGQNTLADVIRSIPQNFTGGQNPGIGTGDQPASDDATGAAALNLRGLGPGATLTLLNGRRLSYSGNAEAVDVSAIPIAAVERIEIIADGGSAIYGADAVGGVANVILRRDYDGVSATGRVGTATDGGYTRYQLSGVAGTQWTSGNIMLAGDFSRNSNIVAGQRSYSGVLHPTAVIYPYYRNWGLLANGRQRLAPTIELNLIALHNQRIRQSSRPSTVTGDYLAAGSLNRGEITTTQISPGFEISLPHRWSLTGSGTYGRERNFFIVRNFSGGNQIIRADTEQRNTMGVFEAGAEGPAFTLPAGDVRLALGGGYRYSGLRRSAVATTATATQTQSLSWSRENYFAYAEVFLPIVSPAMGISGAHRLSLSAAVRYEDYPEVERVATPKFGLIYSPISDVTLSATWGRSFRAPTLSQQFGAQTVNYNLASRYGATGVPANAAALLLTGANEDLRPERSTNWTATFALEPSWLPGARVEIGYFDIDYTDRLADPITPFSASFSNPAFAEFITFSPTPAQIQAAIAFATSGAINNLSGQTVNLANIIAIIDARITNVAKQRARGVDFSAQYQADIGAAGRLTTSIRVSYIDLERQVSEFQPVIQLAGRIFQPPHWRGRGSVTWNRGGLTLAAHTNYTDSLEDVRTANIYSIDSRVTFDLFGSYRFRPSFVPEGVNLSLAVINVLNTKPPRITNVNPSITPFDSTNYTAIGRNVTFSVGVAF